MVHIACIRLLKEKEKVGYELATSCCIIISGAKGGGYCRLILKAVSDAEA